LFWKSAADPDRWTGAEVLVTMSRVSNGSLLAGKISFIRFNDWRDKGGNPVIGLTILVGLVVVLVVVGAFIYFITIYNSLVRLRNDMDKAWANIDVLLKQRHDELPKLIETCKGYMQYEQKTFQLITEARTAFMKASTVAEKAQADNLISGALKSLFAVSENYPDLKANNNFMQLQKRISELEERIADRREFFNDDVNTYNIRIQQLPDVFVAKMLSLERRDLFKVTEEDRRDVEVKMA
jgi:LemA protein